MLLNAHCMLLIAQYSFIVVILLNARCCSMLTACRSRLIVCSLYGAQCSLYVGQCSLYVAQCLLDFA